MRAIKRIKAATVLSAIMFTVIGSSHAYADQTASRLKSIDTAKAFSAKTEELADYVYANCGCDNTVDHLYELSNLGAELEAIAKYGDSSKTSATEGNNKLNEIVEEIEDMRQYVRHMPDKKAQVLVNKGILNTVNELGRAVKGPTWKAITSARACVIGAEETTCEMEDSEDGLNQLQRNLEAEGPDTW